jgi:pentafunctional AROM polypeptide
VKVVGMAKAEADVYVLHNVAFQHTSSGSVPTIAILAGGAGSLSRVLNKFMTPVSHPLLPQRAAPGMRITTISPYSSYRAIIGKRNPTGAIASVSLQQEISVPPTIHKAHVACCHS